MKSILDSFFAAFSLYSAIPVPRTEWTRRSIRFSLCFFPLVGAVCGVALWGWYALSSRLSLSSALFAAGAVLLPLLVTGGIHMDGFIDTCDAVASHAPPEKRLEILKDPHVGAFGVLYCGGMLVLQFGLWQQLYQTPRLLWLPMLGYVLSRACNAFSIATFAPAKTSGLVHLFGEYANRRVVVVTCCVFAAAFVAASMAFAPLWGVLAAVVTAVYVVCHRRFCRRQFGGNTGDLAGFLLQNLEAFYLLLAVLGGVLA